MRIVFCIYFSFVVAHDSCKKTLQIFGLERRQNRKHLIRGTLTLRSYLNFNTSFYDKNIVSLSIGVFAHDIVNKYAHFRSSISACEVCRDMPKKNLIYYIDWKNLLPTPTDLNC